MNWAHIFSLHHLLTICLSCALLSCCGVNYQRPHGTLIIIGVTPNNGIALAADSREQTGEHGYTSGHQKIFPVGKYTAVSFSNRTSLYATAHGKPVADFEFVGAGVDWIKSHPNVRQNDIWDGLTRAIAAQYLAAQTRFPQADLRDGTKVIVVGMRGKTPLYREGLVSGRGNVDEQKYQNIYGLHRIGIVAASTEVLHPTAAVLLKYKNNSAVLKYRKLLDDQMVESVTPSEILDLSRILFAATEDPEATKLDPRSRDVGPPHFYATITAERGFQWVHQ